MAAISVHAFVELVARIAIIVLMVLVGLETSVSEMRRVGRTALLVAALGVVVPFLLGFGAMALLQPEASLGMHLFIRGILTATSVGITARVLRDLGQTYRTEARIILGAAVIDDVLGPLVLAVVSALVATGTIGWLRVAGIVTKSAVFLFSSVAIGLWITPRVVMRLARLEIENVKLLFGLGFAFLFSWLANAFGLATFVGAFARAEEHTSE